MHIIDLREPLRPFAHKFVSMGGDIDYTIYERYINGRMTKARYKLISSYCRRHTHGMMHCGHAHDCCGCITSQGVSFSIKGNQIVISLNQTYNY